jgi:hypothetical protein
MRYRTDKSLDLDLTYYMPSSLKSSLSNLHYDFDLRTRIVFESNNQSLGLIYFKYLDLISKALLESEWVKDKYDGVDWKSIAVNLT